MTGPLSLSFRELPPIIPQSVWDVTEVREALNDHEAGRFQTSAILADSMGRDDRISACLGTRVRALTGKSGLPFSVEEAEGADGRRGRAIAKSVEKIWWDVLPEKTTERILRDSIMLGVAVGRIAWIRVQGAWQPRLIPLLPHYLRWYPVEGAWKYLTWDGELDVTPGDGQWFLHTPYGIESWLGGAIRSLGERWIMRQYSYVDWLRYCEKHGVPILAVTEPQEMGDGASKKAFYARLRNLGRESVVRLPQDSDGRGFDLKFVEPTDRSWQAFEASVQAANLDIAITLLGQNLTTEVSQNGSRAAADIHDRVRRDYLASDVQGLTTAYREQVWMPWGRYAVSGWDDSLAPWGCWDLDPPADLKDRADTLNTLADFLTKMTALNVPVDIEEVCEQYQVPLRDGALIPQPEAPDPNAPPPAKALPPQPADPNAPPQLPEGQTPPVLNQRLDAAAPAFVQGQLYADQLADQSLALGVALLKPSVDAVLAAIEGARSYEEIRKRILAVFKGLDPTQLAATLEKALVLGNLSGRYAILEEI